MPRIAQDTYRIHEVSVSRTDQGRYPHSCQNVIDWYPKNTTIIDWLDGEGMGYLDNPMQDLSLGAEGVLPYRQIESLLRVCNQFAPTFPSR